jgi:glycosyltransferase involved in cell wall biosynthesis
MKYPKVLFFRLDTYNEIDILIESNINLFESTITICSDPTELNKLFDWTYDILVTYGPEVAAYLPLVEPHIVSRINTRWVHYPTLDLQTIPQFNKGINYCYIDNVIKPRESTRPIFSIFTTTYLSYNKIRRAYDSLKAQTMRDWEWVIVDDSPTIEHFNTFLCDEIAAKDHRIRLYRRHTHSGSIGNVKNEAVSLCRGKYVLELDHDDEIVFDCLENATQVFESDPNIGFVYMDFYNQYENGDPFRYSDFISFGYGGYYSQKHRDKWQYVYITPNINNITAFALISLPNHPRMWRRTTLLSVGNYSEALPICDDLEVLQRTFEDVSINVAKIHKVGYIQYMNNGNNNFSLIRNREINRLGPTHIAPQFYNKYKMQTKFKERDAYEDESYLYDHVQLWKRPQEPIYEHKYINQIVNPDYETQVCILGITALHTNLEQIREMYNESYPPTINPNQKPIPKKRYDFILLEHDCDIQMLWELLESHQLDQMKCYVLQDSNYVELLQYFHRLYKSCESTLIIETPPTPDPNSTLSTPITDPNPTLNHNPITMPEYNTEYSHRYELINANTVPEQNYLEIGVEYGQTFCNVHFASKTGVDPSHKIGENKKEVYMIQKMTSDEFFEHMGKFLDIISSRKKHFQSNKFIPKPFRYFDVVFVDGMHQSEYVLRDIINAIKYLNPNGKIFVDDVLPKTHNEQLKVPNNHIVEDGIVKYTEPWTGDVWKVVYYLLKHYSTHFTHKLYHHTNYRGVWMLESIQKIEITYTSAMNDINTYDYFHDYTDYLGYILQQ